MARVIERLEALSRAEKIYDRCTRHSRRLRLTLSGLRAEDEKTLTIGRALRRARMFRGSLGHVVTTGHRSSEQGNSEQGKQQ